MSWLIAWMQQPFSYYDVQPHAASQPAVARPETAYSQTRGRIYARTFTAQTLLEAVQQKSENTIHDFLSDEHLTPQQKLALIEFKDGWGDNLLENACVHQRQAIAIMLLNFYAFQQQPMQKATLYSVLRIAIENDLLDFLRRYHEIESLGGWSKQEINDATDVAGRTLLAYAQQNGKEEAAAFFKTNS